MKIFKLFVIRRPSARHYVLKGVALLENAMQEGSRVLSLERFYLLIKTYGVPKYKKLGGKTIPSSCKS